MSRASYSDNRGIRFVPSRARPKSWAGNRLSDPAIVAIADSTG